MVACSVCGFESPDGFKFCPECGSPLAAAAQGGEERKVVSALFVDLVGFTAMSEAADPEDVDRVLAPYFALARAEIERHGGVVEKFIGDAVVGVFGVPAAHEDDPERAVRAGLRIAEGAAALKAVDGTPLRLRVGINTGEALVRLGVTAASGEGFLVGDAVNTASRLQSAAPELGVAVGLATYEATATVFDYAELEPASLKGKSEPVRVFHARAARARLGTDVTRTHDAPFVGREAERALLTGTFDRVAASGSPRLVSIVGEPGLGKSRLVAELLGHVEAGTALVTWRQGRCLPYGEGITFWALGEIVKAHAGVMESDTAELARARLDAVLPDGVERDWLRQRLLPLLGIEGGAPAEREELFTAWRRFLELIAAAGPTVVVFEDLHWADEAMLAFVDHLAVNLRGVPLLVVGTARPELLDRSPLPDGALALRLEPLSADETERLVSALLDAAVVPADLREPILERAGGNPLYAEEFVRLLRDRDLLVETGGGWTLRAGAEVPLPDSVQALIAARLDMLDAVAKSMLADAAVVGKVFWAGAVVAMCGHGPDRVAAVLDELEGKELVRRDPRSSIAGEVEHAFRHILARDVVYAQLPRPARAARHVAAATWIESKAADRVADHAEVLAYHFGSALELARAAGQAELAGELEAPVLRFLSLAGERALGLDTGAALGSFERALALTPPGHPERAATLVRFGEAARQAGRMAEAAEALVEAIESFRARDELPAAAQAMATLLGVLVRLGDPRAFALPAEAVALLEPLPPGPELVAVLTELAAVETIANGSYDAGARAADRALTHASELGLARPARALGYRGLARCLAGDSGGLADMREAIALATAAGQGRDAVVMRQNLGVSLLSVEGPAAALEVMQAGIAFAEARGLADSGDFLRAGTLDLLDGVGRLDEALALAAELAAQLESDDATAVGQARAAEARILALRGRAAEAAGSLDWLEAAARRIQTVDFVVLGLGSAALARAALGEDARAAALLAEVETSPGAHETLNYPVLLAAFVRTALALGDADLARRLVAGVEPGSAYAEHALATANAALAESEGDLDAAVAGYADAAARWERFGVVAEQGHALLGEGRCLAALGRPEAADVLERARGIFGRLDAAAAVAGSRI